jgi:hypothetical protein
MIGDARRASVILLSLSIWAPLASAAPSNDWDTIKVTGGTAAFRCVSGLPSRIPRARLLVEAGRRLADSGLDDAWGTTLGKYASWLGTLDEQIGALRGVSLSLDDAANRKKVDDILGDLGISVRRRGATATAEPRGSIDQTIERFVTCLTGSREELARRLTAREAVSILPNADEVPLPVTGTAWTALRKSDSPQRLFLSIIGDRDALVLYAALASLDAETLAFVTQPSVWSDVNGSMRLLAAYGNAIRIANGRVDVPGGDALSSPWQKFMNRSPNEAAEFLKAVLRTDEGRLAFFYAALDSFDVVRLNAILAGERDAGRRAYALFVANSPWVPAVRPLSVPALNVVTAARTIVLDADGLPVGPRSRQFWRNAFDAEKLPERSDWVPRKESEPPTLVWLLEQVFADRKLVPERFAMLSFTQRVFPAPTVSPGVLTAVVASKHFPALALALERIGVRDPQVYDALARRAERLTDGDEEVVTVRVRQWQAAVGLVEALRRTGAIDVLHASAALQAIAAWEPGRDGGFAIPLAQWIDTTIRPLLPHDSDDAAPNTLGAEEARLYRLISGPVGRSSQTFKWEGLSYDVDLARAHARRAEAIARIEPRASLDDVVALTSAANALQHAVRAADVATVAADLQGRISRVKPAVPPAPWLKRHEPLLPEEILKTVLKDLARVRQDRDVRRAQRVAPTIVWLADQLFADVLPALLYTGRLGAAAGSPEIYADLWRRHDLAVPASAPNRWQQTWQVAEEKQSAAGGTGLSGSIIGFDVALGRLLLRRVGGGPPPTGVDVPRSIVDPMTRSIGLEADAAVEATAPQELTAVVDAIRRGRSQWASFVAQPQKTEAGWPDSLRINVVKWMKANEPARIDDEISLTELVTLGATPGVSFTPLGIPGDCWCLTFPLPSAFVTVGPWTIPSAGADLPLRLAEALAELHMPISLLPSVAAAGFADVLDSASPVHAADWRAVSDAVRLLSRDRVEQLVFSLVTTRELTVARSSDR